jgi:hypothetical protein
MNDYRYRMIRVVCEGTIKPCEFCKDIKYEDENGEKIMHEGFCQKCGRPLDKKPGDKCNFIVGYQDRGYKQQNKIHFKCGKCPTITTI